MNLKFDTDTPKGVSPNEDSSVYLVVVLDIRLLDAEGKQGGRVSKQGVTSEPQAVGGAHHPVGVVTSDEVQLVEVFAVVKAVDVEHCGSEGWECVFHES